MVQVKGEGHGHTWFSAPVSPSGRADLGICAHLSYRPPLLCGLRLGGEGGCFLSPTVYIHRLLQLWGAESPFPALNLKAGLGRALLVGSGQTHMLTLLGDACRAQRWVGYLAPTHEVELTAGDELRQELGHSDPQQAM